MAQMQNAQSVALQLEKVRDKLPLLYERDDMLLTMIQQRGDAEKVSSRNLRLPLRSGQEARRAWPTWTAESIGMDSRRPLHAVFHSIAAAELTNNFLRNWRD
jgi:hypothetical protein